MLIDATTQAHLAERGGLIPRWLLWISAKNRSAGTTEATGLWTGDDDQTFTVGGQTRSYFGAGGLVSIDPLTYETGTSVQMQRLALGPITPEVAQLLRTYDPRLAPAELHLALFRPLDNSLVSITRALKGWIDEAPVKDGAATDQDGNFISASVCEVTIAASSREGTRTLPLKKSDSAQQRRGGDRGRRYADVSGTVAVWWGEERHEVDG